MKVPIEGVGTYRLILDNGSHLDLLQTIYLPSIFRNVISVSKLDACGFIIKFRHGRFSLYKNDNFIIDYGILFDGLYKIILLNPC